MTKRYWVQQDEGKHAGEWQVLNRRTDLDRMWVASFDKKEHADRFAAELNREEGARQRAANDGALLSASLQASMQINQAMQRQYEQMLRELSPAVMERLRAFTQHKALTLEDVVKASNAVFGPKHKDAIPPPAPSATWAIPDDVKRRWATPNGIGSVVYEPEKPQHPSEGERVRCCRAHADPVFMFNDEVWKSLKERCER